MAVGDGTTTRQADAVSTGPTGPTAYTRRPYSGGGGASASLPAGDRTGIDDKAVTNADADASGPASTTARKYIDTLPPFPPALRPMLAMLPLLSRIPTHPSTTRNAARVRQSGVAAENTGRKPPIGAGTGAIANDGEFVGGAGGADAVISVLGRRI